jgi:hypothetical protein
MLITPEYIAQNAQLHRENLQFGDHGHQWAQEIRRLVALHNFTSVLDYGAGKRRLEKALAPDIAVRSYDPAVLEISSRPDPADLVVCTDVMEHIEPDCLSDVLADIALLSRRMAFLEIATFPAQKHLPDGRNAHLIVQPAPWWLDRLRSVFNVTQVLSVEGRLIAYAAPGRVLHVAA